jgi:large subunit ribosomal protein L30
MAYFRITLLRSGIGLPRQTNGVLLALGLRRRMQTVYRPVNETSAGLIFSVKELVDVQEVEKPLTKTEAKALRTPEPGYWVESRAADRLQQP